MRAELAIMVLVVSPEVDLVACAKARLPCVDHDERSTVAAMTQLTADQGARRRISVALVIAAIVAVGLSVALAAWFGARSPSHEISRQSFKLNTHCGVDRAAIGGKPYVADRPLYREGGTGSPPAGWDDPQIGIMTVFPDGTAVFRHPDGQEVKFIQDARRSNALPICY